MAFTVALRHFRTHDANSAFSSFGCIRRASAKSLAIFGETRTSSRPGTKTTSGANNVSRNALHLSMLSWVRFTSAIPNIAPSNNRDPHGLPRNTSAEKSKEFCRLFARSIIENRFVNSLCASSTDILVHVALSRRRFCSRCSRSSCNLSASASASARLSAANAARRSRSKVANRANEGTSEIARAPTCLPFTDVTMKPRSSDRFHGIAERSNSASPVAFVVELVRKEPPRTCRVTLVPSSGRASHSRACPRSSCLGGAGASSTVSCARTPFTITGTDKATPVPSAAPPRARA